MDVVVLAGGPDAEASAGHRSRHQDDLVTPGSSPRWANSRTQMRHRPNLRYTDFGRPQRVQRE